MGDAVKDQPLVRFPVPNKHAPKSLGSFAVGSPSYGYSRGEFQLSMPGEREQVTETFTCGHCNFVTKVMPRCDPADAGGFCKVCTRLICKGCAGALRCDVIEKKLERSEARGAAIRSYGFE